MGAWEWPGSREPAHGRVVVLTATTTEFRSVCASLGTDGSRDSSPEFTYEVGEFRCPDGRWWDVWVACGGQGNIPAALQASHAIQQLRPDLLVFLGTAGSLNHSVAIGDVVFATRIYGYESGRLDSGGLKARPEVAVADQELIGLARRIAAKKTWHDRIDVPPGAQYQWPEAHVAPICAGEKILADDRSELRRQLRQHFNDAAAVEMEALGFLSAAHYWGNVKAVVVRGISDRLRGKTPRRDQRLQPLACGHATAFLFELLSLFHLPHARRESEFDSRYGMWYGPLSDRTFLPDSDEPERPTLLTRTEVPSLELVGKVVDHRYELVREIGRGALNGVWEAEEKAFGQSLGRVALKMQPPSSKKRFLYFRREAELISSFDSPYVLPYRSAWTEAAGPLRGWSFIATGLGDMSLRDAVRGRALVDQALLRLMADLGRGLCYLHDQGLVHGDVKPANILRYHGRWVLGDFGLTQKPGTYEPQGTIEYMAPERFKGVVTPPNDIYAYAVTSIIATTDMMRSETPTLRNDGERLAELIRRGAPEPPGFRPQWFPGRLAGLLYAALASEPGDRPSMAEITTAVEEALAVIPYQDPSPPSRFVDSADL
ncbi:protein kinase [Streptomyces sp. NPDC002677]|uniref:phosphorylase family protein n=1 Tax=Streptomyces sp. NPDC002677 TaxID=3154774 RepID=UPI003324C081